MRTHIAPGSAGGFYKLDNGERLAASRKPPAEPGAIRRNFPTTSDISMPAQFVPANEHVQQDAAKLPEIGSLDPARDRLRWMLAVAQLPPFAD